MKLVLPILVEGLGPPNPTSLVLEMDGDPAVGFKVASFHIKDSGLSYTVQHDELLDFASSLVAVIQARRPRVSPY